MTEVLHSLKDFEVWIYGLLGIVGLLSLVKFAKAWNEMRQAAFGLELESAQQQLNQAATTIVLVIMFSIGEFFLVNIVIPNIPEATSLPTPTLNVLVTPTVTLPANETESITPSPETELASIAMESTANQTPNSAAGGCIPQQIEITNPISGSSITGIQPIEGSANIPNFGFYKFEFSSPGQTNWLAIQAWTTPKKNEVLGQWDTSRLPSGLYLLRLVVTDNQGKALTPCVIQVNVVQPEQ